MAKQHNIWWGPPKKFSTHFEERKISWLELFYDLVYVIVISKITHRLATNADCAGILDYAYLFIITFWGWYNGSQYHDLHGSPGIRTRFMTLWQMMAVGALAVTLDSPTQEMIHRYTVGLLFLQLFITYLWWSVGIYDKHHRKLNIPYTISFLIAFILLIVTLYLPQPYKRIVFWLALLLNYFPFFYTALRLRERNDEFSMSSSMSERLGLFTIIVFGEAILGVINSINDMPHMYFTTWLYFGMGILIVFALWWIFFSLIADRENKKGMLEGIFTGVLFIPALASLGMIGAAFPSLLDLDSTHPRTLQIIFGVSIAMFLFSITAISRLLIYPKEYERGKKPTQLLIVGIGVVNLLFIPCFNSLGVITYLCCVLFSLLVIVVLITRSWFRIELNKLA